jgi:hypothetical protein
MSQTRDLYISVECNPDADELEGLLVILWDGKPRIEIRTRTCNLQHKHESVSFEPNKQHSIEKYFQSEDDGSITVLEQILGEHFKPGDLFRLDLNVTRVVYSPKE